MTASERGTMPEPDITTTLSIDEVCAALGTKERREVIEQVAMRGWVSADILDTDAIVALKAWGIVRVRGDGVERGEQFEAALRTLNAIAREQRDLR